MPSFHILWVKSREPVLSSLEIEMMHRQRQQLNCVHASSIEFIVLRVYFSAFTAVAPDGRELIDHQVFTN